MSELIVPCSGCGGHKSLGDMLYDFHADIFFCDRECFDEWADKSGETISEYYYRMNIE